MRISDWSSDVCSSDLAAASPPRAGTAVAPAAATARSSVVDKVARIVSEVLNLGGLQVDRQVSLHELGLDSLVAVEIKNRVAKELGIAVSVRDLSEGASIEAIAGAQPASDDTHGRFNETSHRGEAIDAQPENSCGRKEGCRTR